MKLDFLIEVLKNPVVTIFFICIVADTLFGVLRAFKQKTFNSAFGIDGAIRKMAMILGIILLAVVDSITGFNFIKYVPKEVIEPLGLTTVGLTVFFAILFILYEVISIIKNLTMCGVPFPPFITKFLENLLNKYTNELPNNEDKATD
ncbi:MAG: phage holin family protein [Anaerorhabdus sp.]|uniref:phage holin family protein n=1 Tax=Anaerorhabdus sp. TaxID=1872524 RepID=UPI003A848F5B